MTSTAATPTPASETEFRLIADSAPVLIWVTALDRRRTFVNRAYLEFGGLSFDEALAFDWRAIIHPDDIERILSESAAGEASLATFGLTARYRRADGAWRWLHSVSQPRWDGEGGHIGFIGVAHDVTDAKAAELDLIEREEQLSAFVNQTMAGFSQVDLDGRFTLVNDRFCEITGRTRKELLGLRMQQITHPDHLPGNVTLFDRAVRLGEPYAHEKRYIRPDGTSVWVNNSVSVVRRADGEPYGVLAISIDVTDRYQAEAALRRSEENVRLAVEGAGMATWELDLDTMEGPWSPNRFDLLGYPRAASLRGTFRQWIECVHPEDRRLAQEAVERCFNQGTAFEIEYRICRADTGEVRWLTSHGSRIQQQGGRRSRFVGVSFDVTERKRVEAELRENESRLAFLDALGKATAGLTDADHILAITTRLLGEQLGLSDCAYADIDEDGDGMNIRGDWAAPGRKSIVGRYRLSAFGSQSVARLSAGEPLILEDIAAELGDDGAEAFLAIGIQATVCMPQIRNGRLVALMAIHDHRPRRWTWSEIGLTGEVVERSWAHIERVRALQTLRETEAAFRSSLERAVEERTAELRVSEDALRQAQKLEAIGQLTGGVAHDFNNLLMVISAGLNLLDKSDDPARREMLMSRMRESVTRGANLTQQLLAFSRKQALSPEVIDVAVHVTGMSDLLDRSLGGGVAVEVALPEGLNPVFADQTALQLALLNLAVNARDAMAGQGTIGISAVNGTPEDIAADFVSISVSDEGAGMTPEVQTRIFEPFFTTKEIGKGSGLGLAQVHGFVEQSGGRIAVRSAPGEGTTFTLILPAAHASPAAGDASRTVFRAAPSGEAQGFVLLVEDDDEVAALSAEMLDHLGWRVGRVASAEAALARLKEGAPCDLLFSDVMMPGGMSGVDLARAVREVRPDLPVVLTSGYSEPMRSDIAELGVPLLPKPYNLDTLAAVFEVARLSERSDRAAAG